MPNTYTDVPIGSHTLAQDQPLMEENFLYLANTLGTSLNASKDHQIGLNGVDTTSFEGRHRQVSFNNQVIGSVTPAFSDGATAVLFTNNQGDISVTFPSFGAAATRLTLNSKKPVASANGFSWLPAGLLIQWGSFDPTSSTSVSFPTSFPNNAFSCILTGEAANNSTYRAGISQGTLTVSGFDFEGTVNPDWNPIYYIAIGN